MANAASDHAALASAKAARDMQDGVVRKRDDAMKTMNTHGSHAFQGSPLAADSSTSRKDALTTRSANIPRNGPKQNTKDISLAHQAAIRRLKSRTTGPASKSSPTTQSTISSQPVLVNAAPRASDMKKKQKPSANRPSSPNLPTPENFSFQEILASIGPEADAAIEAIAEICGRSKMSLADEHGSHMPPQGEVEALPIARMETLDERRRNGVQTRAMARRLAMAKTGEAVSSDATAATSSVMSHASTNGSGRGRGETRPMTYTSMLPQILSWLRGSSGNDSGQDTGAAGRLHRLLSEHPLSEDEQLRT